MTEAEKAEARQLDARVRALIERTERLEPEALQRLHGELVSHGQPRFRPGDRVRLRPRPRGDVFDLVLKGRTATIRAVEVDFEDRLHLSVTIDDDPGQDLGIDGQPGHRFFFGPDEVEPLEGGP
jgi:hydrogenase maturation protease